MELGYRRAGNRDTCGSSPKLYLSIDICLIVYYTEIECYSFILEYTSAIVIGRINDNMDCILYMIIITLVRLIIIVFIICLFLLVKKVDLRFSFLGLERLSCFVFLQTGLLVYSS